MKVKNKLSATSIIFFLSIWGLNFSYAKNKLRSGDHPNADVSLVEIAGNVDGKELRKFCEENHLPNVKIYQWQNHYVIYNELPEVNNRFFFQLDKKFPGTSIKSYSNPFYKFNRADHCKGASVAEQWDHVILSADIKGGEKTMQEYLDYHKTQFQKWPEVANGFCNANFQRLLVFLGGRQLMIVISIPKGESLDKLNPLTTKNNPRVVEWNKLMSKYQTGIVGTKKGDTWVFFKEVK